MKYIISTLPKDLHASFLAFVFFFLYLVLNFLIYKKLGPAHSPITQSLLRRGYDLTFGIVVATTYIVAALLSFVIIALPALSSFNFGRMILVTIIMYLITAIAFNFWGQYFLKIKGINPKPAGWRGFWSTVKYNAEQYKKKHSLK